MSNQSKKYYSNHQYTVFPNLDSNHMNNGLLENEYDPNFDAENRISRPNNQVPSYDQNVPIVTPVRDSEDIPYAVPVVDSIIYVGEEENKLNANIRPVDNHQLGQNVPVNHRNGDLTNDPLLDQFRYQNQNEHNRNNQDNRNRPNRDQNRRRINDRGRPQNNQHRPPPESNQC